MKQYTIQHPVDLTLGAFTWTTGGRFFTMYDIVSTDTAENVLLDGDTGEYPCWDSDVQFVEGGLRIEGAEGPGGYSKIDSDEFGTTLFIPQRFIKTLTITEEDR